jgi:hypothetical protein
MAVPTITSTDQPAIRAGGRTLLEITGTNYRLPTPPPLRGPVPPRPPSVRVTFTCAQPPPVNGVAQPILSRVADSAYVMSPTLIRVVPPPLDAGPCAITVENIDDAGVLIPGETVTAPLLLTVEPYNLTAISTVQAVIRALVADLRRQTIANVVITTSSEYDEETGTPLDITAKATLPVVQLLGPRLPENRFYTSNVPRRIPDGAGGVYQLRQPFTCDVVFTVMIAGDNEAELLNLSALLVTYAQRNIFLRVPIDLSNLALGDVQYEMSGGDMEAASHSNESNLHQMTGTLTIRGVEIDEADMRFGRTAPAADYVVSGQSYADGSQTAVIVGPDTTGDPPAPAFPGGAGSRKEPIYQLDPPGTSDPGSP